MKNDLRRTALYEAHRRRGAHFTYSPVLGHPIALGYAVPPFATAGRHLTVVDRGRRVKAQVVDLPFYRRGVTPLPASERERDS